MASTDAIDQILCDSNVIDLPAEVEVLITAIKQLIRTRQKVGDAHVTILLQLTCFHLNIEEVPETTWRGTKGKQQAKEMETELEVRRRALVEGHPPDDMADSESFLPVTFLTLIRIRNLYVLNGSKVKARVQRWEEACKLVRDEMDRVLLIFKWQARWWQTKAERSVRAPRAYALCQAALREHTHNHCAVSSSYVDRWIELGQVPSDEQEQEQMEP
ncbi:hypothetical protein F5146DRAFT_997632 [Armillaria mellea]|nr:hypothetical protein F5146DRAFT_997632 [Armillaria mellea]